MTINYRLTRAATAVPTTPVRLTQGGSVSIEDSWLQWSSKRSGSGANASVVSDEYNLVTCFLDAPSETCGATTTTITPFANGGPFGGVQSGPGTGASGSMTVTFSVPVTSVKVIIQDPTFAGNTVTAIDPAGGSVFGYSFLFSGQAGVNNPDSVIVTGKIGRLDLVPASNDYVAYHILVTIGRQLVIVVCTPSTVTRGQTVECKTTLNVPQPFTVVKRRAKGSGFTQTDNLPAFVTAGGEDNWRGTAVATSEVKVTVRVDDNGTTREISNDYPVRFTVQPRTTWPTWQLTTLGLRQFVVCCKMTPYPVPGTPLGVMHPSEPTPTIERVTSGPNIALAYISQPYQVTEYQVGLHRALSPDPAGIPPTDPRYTDMHKWFDDQNGTGSGTCPQSDVAQLLANVDRHEGTTMSPTSHFGIANQQFTLLKPQEKFEVLYTGKTDDELKKLIRKTWLEFDKAGGPYRTAQDQFDTNDTPLVFTNGMSKVKGKTCKFDFNSSDS